jgi:3'-phosphoadenosine 5'-phosphosulfate sulfotransferase
MAYRNKTYVIFDADNDIWAYRFMRGWKAKENIDFNFHDAHDLSDIRQTSTEETIKRRLRERFSSSKQAIVLIGEHTKNLHRFVRWEIEVAQNLDLPIVAVNLNKKRQYDSALCPTTLRDKYVVHISFNAKIIKYALDNFPGEYAKRDKGAGGNRHYNTTIYSRLGI